VFDGLLSRHARPNLTQALAESRAVALIGARQVGKSTLARDLAANEFPAQYISLDDDTLPFGDRLAAVPLQGLWAPAP